MKTKPIIFYHYCSAKSFFEIVATKQIFMADATKTNDYNEMIFLFEDFENVFLNTYEKNKFEIKIGNSIGKDAILAVYNAGLEFQKYNGENSYTNYVFCLSEKNNSLNQWRSYARNGSGFALGFYYEKLNKFANSNNRYSLAKVQYLKKSALTKLQTTYVLNILNGLQTLYLKEKSNSNIKYILFEYSYSMFQKMAEDAVLYKSADFSEEKEWRLIYKCLNRKENIASGNNSELKLIDFYYKNEDIISFIPIQLEQLLVEEENIKQKNELYFGPQNKTYIVDILMYLEKNNINNVECKKSEITYRSNFGNALKN